MLYIMIEYYGHDNSNRPSSIGSPVANLDSQRTDSEDLGGRRAIFLVIWLQQGILTPAGRELRGLGGAPYSLTVDGLRDSISSAQCLEFQAQADKKTIIQFDRTMPRAVFSELPVERSFAKVLRQNCYCVP